MRSLICLLSLLFLAACQSAQFPSPQTDSHPGLGRIADAWDAYVERKELIVRRQIEIDPELTGLLAGLQPVESSALEEILRSAGASQVGCQARQFFGKLSLECEYRIPAYKSSSKDLQEVLLPDLGLLDFLANIPQQAANGILIQEKGHLTVPGVFTMLPAAQTWRYPNGGYLTRRFSFSSPSKLIVTGETRLPPGSEWNTLVAESIAVGFVRNYLARPSAWLAFGLALASILASLAFIYPVRARLPLQPRPWTPNLSRVPFFMHWLAKLIVHFVNWLLQTWPRLLNISTALIMLLLGIQALALAWSISGLYDRVDQLESYYDNLVAQFPFLGGLEFLLWAGWPIMLALIGIGLILTGSGLLARRELARYLVAGMSIAVIGGLIYLWPQLLLSPAFIPFQLGIILGLGEIILVTAALITRGFTHPQFRRYYSASGDDE